jgi:UDP-glucose 4-epimerase
MLNGFEKVVVTGGAAFIGSYICEELIKLDGRVIVIDDLSTGKEGNIPAKVGFTRIDISEPDRLGNAMKSIAFVFHVAAQPSTRESIDTM